MITLKCIKAPQRAKNLTENVEYEGIYIDSEDIQVDVREEASYFLCKNDTGTEVRYKLDLFEIEIMPISAPVLSPEPPRLTLEQLNRIYFNHNNIYIIVGNEYIHLISNIILLNNLSEEGSGISCGVACVQGLNNLWSDIYRNVILDRVSSEISREFICKLVFKKAIEKYLENNYSTYAFLIFSTTMDYPFIEEVMDELAESTTEWHTNPNSNNDIKVWVLATGYEREDEDEDY